MKKSLRINSTEDTYIIAEVGHSHQGNTKLALELVKRCALGGANAVKFQKRNTRGLYTSKFYSSPYTNRFSFGQTYGAHREFLDPSLEMLQQANITAHEFNLDFIITPFDLSSLDFCEKNLFVDAYKIASGDITNHELIEAIASRNKPVFCSCGAASLKEIEMAIDLLKNTAKDFVVMYTYSEYPLSEEHIFLGSIPFLKTRYKLDDVGYSCHSPLLDVSRMAVAAGASYIEKHIKSDLVLRLSDDLHSILPEDLYLIKKPIPLQENYSGVSWTTMSEVNENEIEARYKLGKSLYYLKDMLKGDIISADNIIALSPAEGIPPYLAKEIIGKRLIGDVVKEQIILLSDFM